MDRFISDEVDWALDKLDRLDPKSQAQLRHYVKRFLAHVEGYIPDPETLRALVARYIEQTRAAMMADDVDAIRAFVQALRARMREVRDR